MPVRLGGGLGWPPFGQRSGGETGRAQRLEQGDQTVVSQCHPFSGIAPGGLGVGLFADAPDQRIIQRRGLEMCPWQFQRRAELFEEMLDPPFAAGQPEGLERAHERPAQAAAVADRIVDFADRGQIIAHQPQGLAPQRLHQPVGDEGIVFAPHQ